MNIVLVDDDLDDVLLFRQAIKDINKAIDCVELGSGADLLNYLAIASYTPRLIFLDYNMPGMNGLECLKALRAIEKYREIPVVVYTTYLSDFQRRQFADYDVAILYKPYSYSELVEAVEAKIMEMAVPFQYVAESDFGKASHQPR